MGRRIEIAKEMQHEALFALGSPFVCRNNVAWTHMGASTVSGGGPAAAMDCVTELQRVGVRTRTSSRPVVETPAGMVFLRSL